jgi:hypothetical protein
MGQTMRNHLYRLPRPRARREVVLTLVAVFLTFVVEPIHGEASTRKVALVVFENASYAKIVGSASAPYMNSLISQGLLFTEYHAITTGSAHNYRAMSSGMTDSTSPPPPNIYQAIDQSTGLGWISLQESMDGTCGAGTIGTVPGTNVALYTPGHDASHMYRANESCATHDVALVSDSQLADLPDFSVIIPNQCDDMHTYPTTGTCPSYFGSVSGSNARHIGDSWLHHDVPAVVALAAMTVLVKFDE